MVKSPVVSPVSEHGKEEVAQEEGGIAASIALGNQKSSKDTPGACRHPVRVLKQETGFYYYYYYNSHFPTNGYILGQIYCSHGASVICLAQLYILSKLSENWVCLVIKSHLR